MFGGRQINHIKLYTEPKKNEMYIKFSLKLRVFLSNIVKECIGIYNHKCFKVYMTYRDALLDFPVA